MNPLDTDRAHPERPASPLPSPLSPPTLSPQGESVRDPWRGYPAPGEIATRERTPFSYEGYCVVDVETTGLDPDKDRVIQISMLLLDSEGAPLYHPKTGAIRQFTGAINPQRPIPENIQKMTRVTEQLVATQPVFREAISLIERSFRNRVIVAHNADFDMKMLRAEFARNGAELNPQTPVACTCNLARLLDPGAERHTLGSLSERYDIPLGDAAHDAGADVAATAAILRRFIGQGYAPETLRLDAEYFRWLRSRGDLSPASEKQKRRVFALARECGLTTEEGGIDYRELDLQVAQITDATIDGLTRESVQDVYDHLQKTTRPSPIPTIAPLTTQPRRSGAGPSDRAELSPQGYTR